MDGVVLLWRAGDDVSEFWERDAEPELGEVWLAVRPDSCCALLPLLAELPCDREGSPLPSVLRPP